MWLAVIRIGCAHLDYLIPAEMVRVVDLSIKILCFYFAFWIDFDCCSLARNITHFLIQKISAVHIDNKNTL